MTVKDLVKKLQSVDSGRKVVLREHVDTYIDCWTYAPLVATNGDGELILTDELIAGEVEI
jgi:hypothetical protein